MSGMREMAIEDLFKLNRIFFDPLTEVYSLSFLINKILEFPMLAAVAVAPNEQLSGLIMGSRTGQDEIQGPGKVSHGHVSILSIDYEFRRLGAGLMLMKHVNNYLNLQKDWYVDLFVRSKNQGAIRFYELIGYVMYRCRPKFYGDDNGYEMRFSLSRDVNRVCVKRRDNILEGIYFAGLLLMQRLRTVFARLKNTIQQFLDLKIMTTLREMHADDLFKFNALVFDWFTEVYRVNFFLRHLVQWPELAISALTPCGQLAGFIFGKMQEGEDEFDFHGHVCALTVASDCRRVGVASLLMNKFTATLDQKNAWYVDLYLRCSNQGAYKLYCSLGYCLRRILLEYYPGAPDEDAYDMRKPLAIDKQHISLTTATRQSVRLPSEDSTDEEFF